MTDHRERLKAIHAGLDPAFIEQRKQERKAMNGSFKEQMIVQADMLQKRMNEALTRLDLLEKRMNEALDLLAKARAKELLRVAMHGKTVEVTPDVLTALLATHMILSDAGPDDASTLPLPVESIPVKSIDLRRIANSIIEALEQRRSAEE